MAAGRAPVVVALLALGIAIPAMVGTQTKVAAHTPSPQAALAAVVNDEIHSSYGDNATQMYLYWRGTDSSVSYGTTTAYGTTRTASAPAIQPVDNVGPFKQIKLTGLAPNTTYHYRIGSEGNDNTFQTAPTGNFTWDDIGDTGTTYFDPSAGVECNKTWMSQIWVQLANDNPDFVTHGGDISYANECGRPSVHQLYNDIAPVATKAPLQFSWGNHEYGAPSGRAPPGTPRDSMANYKGRHMMPNPQTVPADGPARVTYPGCPSPQNPSVNGCRGDDWGYFTAGHVLFISYPEPWFGAYPSWKTKTSSLMAAAQADPNIYMIVTYGHRPAYSSQPNNSTVPELTTAINSLGDLYSPAARADGKYVLNVAHHVHGGEVFVPQHGVMHITNGGGGTGEAGLKTPAPGSVWQTNHPEYMRATVVGGVMTVKMICGPIFALNPNREACVKGSVLHTETLTGYTGGTQTPPVAAFTSDCDDLSCDFDGSDSSDSDGTVDAYEWDFGDGNTATGETPATHTYGAEGDYLVQLSVTDDDLATDTVSHLVSVGTQPEPEVDFVGAAHSDASSQRFKTATLSPQAQAGDTAVLVMTRATTVTWTGPTGVTGWTQEDSFASGGLTSTVWTKTVAAGEPGDVVRFDTANFAKAMVTVAVYSGVDASGPAVTHRADSAVTSHTTPLITTSTDDWVASYWVDKSDTTTTWTPPASVTSRDVAIGTGTGRYSSLLADSGGPVSAASYGGKVATTNAASRALMWSIALPGG